MSVGRYSLTSCGIDQQYLSNSDSVVAIVKTHTCAYTSTQVDGVATSCFVSV